MNKVAAAQALGATQRFLAKVKRQNEPFQAYLDTQGYKLLNKGITTAVRTQADAVAKALKELDPANTLVMNDDLQPLNDSNIVHLQSLIQSEMPPLSTLVPQRTVYRSLKSAFSFSVKAQYKRWGLMVKAADVNFKLTNQNYISALNDQSNYLLNNSNIDSTTMNQMISLISDGKSAGLTIDEVADELSGSFKDVSDKRAFVISRTETAQAMGTGNLATMKENNVQTKHWVTAGANPCEICTGNEADGSIPVDASFSSGDDCEPAHPNDECYTEADEIDLDSLDVWDGGDDSGDDSLSNDIEDLPISTPVQTVFHGQGNELSNPAVNMLGDGFYVARDEETASHFGDVTPMEVPLTAKDILFLDTDSAYDSFVTAAQRYAVKTGGSLDTRSAFPAYIKHLGYKAAEISDSIDPMGGLNVVDQDTINYLVSQLPKGSR